MNLTLDNFTALSARPIMVQAILDALAEGDNAHAGFLLKMSLELMPLYQQADSNLARLAVLTDAAGRTA